MGDAYEYLMRNFATESGKSKGQFYTPAEVSRILVKVEAKLVAARMKELKKAKANSEEARVLAAWSELADSLKKQSKLVKELNAALEAALQAKYAVLSDEEIKELLVNRKWYYSLFAGIKALYVTASHSMANRIAQLAERYENTLPQLEQEVADYAAKVRAHLERMGFQW